MFSLLRCLVPIMSELLNNCVLLAEPRNSLILFSCFLSTLVCGAITLFIYSISRYPAPGPYMGRIGQLYSKISLRTPIRCKTFSPISSMDAWEASMGSVDVGGAFRSRRSTRTRRLHARHGKSWRLPAATSIALAAGNCHGHSKALNLEYYY